MAGATFLSSSFASRCSSIISPDCVCFADPASGNRNHRSMARSDGQPGPSRRELARRPVHFLAIHPQLSASDFSITCDRTHPSCRTFGEVTRRVLARAARFLHHRACMSAATDPFRRTKIIFTLGPATESEEMLEKLIRGGADIVRLNMAHAKHEWTRTTIRRIRAISERIGREVAVMMDIKGPEIRTGDLANPIDLKPGEIFDFTVQPAGAGQHHHAVADRQ